jgi:fibronectin-binding autotransporter adhesin
VLSPGSRLTIQSTLTFSADATFSFRLNSNNITSDKVVVRGVTINSGAQFSLADLGSTALQPGTVFIVIRNTGATPIAGNFSNLPDGSTFTSNGNTYQVSYEGGDGNDFTLTVIP